MPHVINLKERFPDKENLITPQPLEFRLGDWQSGYVMMCTREEANRYQAHRRDAFRSPGHQHVALVPNHITLEGGYHYTVLGLFRYRSDESRMRRVYRLAGLMECVTNVPSPILRTDLLRRFYKTILEEREELNLVWRGNVPHFLFPIHPQHYNPNLFQHRIVHAETLKDLFEAIESETNVQFDILSQHYMFYVPESFLPPDARRSEK